MTNPKQMQETVHRTIKFAPYQLVAWKNIPELGSCQSSNETNMLCDSNGRVFLWLSELW